MKTSLISFSTACLALAFAGAAHAENHISVGIRLGAPAPIIVRRAPPRPIAERVIVSPGPGYVWIAGHNSWTGSQWVWTPGMWVMPPQPSAVYVEGRWDERTQNWIDGYWSVQSPPPQVVVGNPGPGPDIIIDAPPPPRHEVMTVRPSREHVWVPGYWAWRGRRHEWVAGRWELPPRGHARWNAPHYEHRGNSYVFIEGTWR